jgi:signal transduction histidine kinase/CheY-like chemotaxis protein
MGTEPTSGWGRTLASILRRYGLVVAATGFILAAWLMLPVAWGARVPFSAFLVVVGAGAVLHGVGPGLFAVVLGAVAGCYFGKPRFTWVLESRLDVLDLFVFVVTGTLAALGAARLRRALTQSHADREAVREAHEELARRARDERRRLEREVAARTAELEDLVAEHGHLTEREHAARVEAERESQLRDEFLATASHELRTPLNVILGWSDLLLRAETPDGRMARGLGIIRHNAKALAQIVADLLDASRLHTGKLRLDVEHVDLLDVVDAALEEPRRAAAEKRVALRTDLAPARVLADPGRLQQVVWNLASNAVKFTPEGGRVEITVAARDGDVVLQVADDGQGIDPDFLPFVFDRFRQADASAARASGGLGLGLAIVKQIVALHGGDVRAASEGRGRGATFTVTLPSAPAAGAGAPGTATVACDLHGVSVLVVDDQPDAREIVRAILEDHGAAVSTAASGPDALRASAASAPDVLVTDIGMPGMDGYTLARHLRGVPAVALTAYARAEDRERALAAGFRAYVTKPFDAANLVAAIAACLPERPAPQDGDARPVP